MGALPLIALAAGAVLLLLSGDKKKTPGALPPSGVKPAVYTPPGQPQPQPPAPVFGPTATPFPNPGSMAYVATHDTGPDGNLNIRATPSTSGKILSSVSHGSSLLITGGASPDGEWYQVQTPAGVQGWAWAGYLVSQPLANVGGGTGSDDTPPGQEIVHSDPAEGPANYPA